MISVDINGKVTFSIALQEMALISWCITSTRSRAETTLASLHDGELGAELASSESLRIAAEVAVADLVELSKGIESGHGKKG